MEINQIYKIDCLEGLRKLPDNSVDLVLTDPPYNIGKADWDKIPDYINWCVQWIKECERVLTDTGSLYFWHNDMTQISALMEAIKAGTKLVFRQFCIWPKFNHRKFAWNHPGEDNHLRNWFGICEYCLYYVKGVGHLDFTGLDRINSNPGCFRPLKDWYAAELNRQEITQKDIADKYTDVTGRKPYMLHHYFQNSQFEIPTKEIWESVYMPLGFGKSYEELRQSYEELRQSYEKLRPIHRTDPQHCNVWISGQKKGCESSSALHPCEKPVDILARIIQTSCREGGTVLDCFAGSGSTAIACLETGRNYILFENDEEHYNTCVKRVADNKLVYTE